MHRFMVAFLAAFALAGIGVVVGQFLPPILLIPVMILQVVLVIIMIFVRKTKISYGLLYTYMFISGLTIYAVVTSYIKQLGAETVIMVLVLAFVVFCSIAVYGSLSKFNYGFLGNGLFYALLALLMVSVIGWFIPFSSLIEQVTALAGILIFSGYTLYDFNKIAKEGLRDDEIPDTVLSVYLDFINLFFYFLRFIASLRNND